MKKIIISFGLLGVLLLSGCGYKEGVATGEQESYLYFSGNTANVTVSIDNGEQFTVKPGRDNQYRVKPGKHAVRVLRDGKLIVDREVYVGDGVAKEIGVN